MSKLLILDANIIIEAHRNRYWAALSASFKLHIPETVLQECKYFLNQSGVREDIDLSPDVESGRVMQLEASWDEMKSFNSSFRESFIESLDPGELEAIAIIYSRTSMNWKFCTIDRRAISALAVIDRSASGISLEAVMKQAGISTKHCPSHGLNKVFNQELGKGLQERESCLLKNKI